MHLEVVAAVVGRDDRVLVARRVSGARAGRWEFPGGKVRSGESHAAAVRRELEEELGVAVDVGAHLCTVRHDYPDLSLDLHAYRCREANGGEPHLRSGDHDALRWVRVPELARLDLCEADREIAARLSRDEESER